MIIAGGSLFFAADMQTGRMLKEDLRQSRKSSHLLVGASRFELPTTHTPSECATRLRYAPICRILLELTQYLPEPFLDMLDRPGRLTDFFLLFRLGLGFRLNRNKSESLSDTFNRIPLLI